MVFTMVDKKILLVENEIIEAMDIKRLLESFGYEVPYVASIDEAIKKASEILPDLILINIILKGDIEDIESFSKIKDLNIPIIYLTTYSKHIKIQKTKLNEPYGYIIKPYHRGELKNAIKLAIDKNENEKEFLENIIENIPSMVFIKNAENLNFKMVNKAAEYLLGHTREELIGENDYNFFPKDEADFFTEKDREVLQNKKLLDIPEETIKTKNLGQRILHTKKIPILNQDGTPQYLLGISEDITQRKKIEKTLADAYLTVKKQKSDLIASNLLLKAEIKERKRMGQLIRDNILRMNIALESADMGAWDLDIVNDTSIRTLDHDKIFGYDSLVPEWGAKILFEHILPVDREYVQQRFEKSYETNKLYFQCRIIRKDKEIRWIEAYGNVYHDDKGVPVRILGVIGDITERKETETYLLTALEEKEMLLREIHHRVKNNMQIISSFLSMQSSQVFDKRDADLFSVIQDRVKSMAFIHDNLYQSEDLTNVKIKEYIKTLTTQLFARYSSLSKNIKLETDIIDVTFNMETSIPLGLIISELVTNSLKHAFNGSKGEIFISLLANGEEAELIIRDNGVGVPKDFDLKKPEKLGLILLNNLVEQLEGTIVFNRNHGTEFKITFKELKYKKRL